MGARYLSGLVLLVCLLAAGAWEMSSGAQSPIHTHTGVVNKMHGLPSRARSRDVDSHTVGQYYVQFKALPTAEERSHIEQQFQLSLREYIPVNTFRVRMSSAAAYRLNELPTIAWIGEVENGHKVALSVTQALKNAPSDDMITLRVRSYGSNWQSAVAGMPIELRQVSTLSAEVVVRPAELASVVRLLEAHAEVTWVEVAAPIELFNKYARNVTQSGVDTMSPIYNMGLTGVGQLIGIGDTGVDVESCFFSDPDIPFTSYAELAQFNATRRKIVQYTTASSAIPGDASGEHHGTHVAGSAAGSTSDSYFSQYDGVAPAAKIAVFDIGGANDSLQIANITMMFESFHTQGVLIQSNSWGMPQDLAYSTMSMDVDAYTNSHQDFLVLFAAGNNGADYSVSSPGNAKNVLTVGATFNSLNSQAAVCGVSAATLAGASVGGQDTPASLAAFSSRGPTSDFRFKPDVANVGEWVVSARASSSGGPTCNVTLMAGTSMATPITAGSVALVRQYLTDGFYPTGAANASHAMPAPSAALLKGMIVHSAVDLTGTVATTDDVCNPPSANLTALTTSPAPATGFGRVQLDQVLRGQSSSYGLYLDQASVSDGGSNLYCVNVATAGVAFKATLVWSDPAASTYAAFTLVNNLDLVVHGANTFVGNDPHNQKLYDYINNVERVSVNAASAGQYTVVVRGTHVPQGPQNYALVVTGGGLDATNVTSGACTSTPSCNGHGSFVPATGLCSCTGGYQGADCSVMPATLTRGVVNTKTGAATTWGYYQAVIAGGELSMTVTAANVGASRVFVSRNVLPTLLAYDQALNTSVSSSIVINTTSATGTYYIGVYGPCCTAWSVNLTVTVFPTCIEGSVCRAAQCVANYFSNVSVCDGANTCVAGTNTSCSPYKCSVATGCPSSCAADSDCISTHYCDGTNACVAKSAAGAVCAIARECVSGFCADNVCCTTACTGLCQSCLAPNGTCTPFTAQTDPLGECGLCQSCSGTLAGCTNTTRGSSSAQCPVSATCGNTGNCDGFGACQLANSSVLCGAAPTCVGSYLNGQDMCSGRGSCVSPPHVSCAPYTCNDTMCLDACANDTDCFNGYFECNNGTCTGGNPAGLTCEADAECASGFCVGGICCTTACSGVCRTCASGNCTARADNEDPANDCGTCGTCNGLMACRNVTAGTSKLNGTSCAIGAPCGNTGTCDGAGQCAITAAGVQCGPLAVCSNATFTANSTCSGTGSCVLAVAGAPACSGYACVAGGPQLQCLSQCSSNADCVANYECTGSACVAIPATSGGATTDPTTSAGATTGAASSSSSTTGAAGTTGAASSAGATTGAAVGSTTGTTTGKINSTDIADAINSFFAKQNLPSPLDMANYMFYVALLVIVIIIFCCCWSCNRIARKCKGDKDETVLITHYGDIEMSQGEQFIQ